MQHPTPCTTHIVVCDHHIDASDGGSNGKPLIFAFGDIVACWRIQFEKSPGVVQLSRIALFSIPSSVCTAS